MDPVYGSNGKFMEIVIPANEAINADVLLEKYGIHADVSIVEGGTITGGDSNSVSDSGTKFTYPYAFFHWFFSFFSPSNIFKSGVKEEPIKETVVEEPIKDTVVEDPIKDTVVEESIKDTVVDEPIKETAVEESIKDTVDEPIKETVVEDPIKDTVVEESIKDTVEESIKDTVVDEPIKETVEDPVVNSSNKSMKITITSIDGVRPW